MLQMEDMMDTVQSGAVHAIDLSSAGALHRGRACMPCSRASVGLCCRWRT